MNNYSVDFKWFSQVYVACLKLLYSPVISLITCVFRSIRVWWQISCSSVKSRPAEPSVIFSLLFLNRHISLLCPRRVHTLFHSTVSCLQSGLHRILHFKRDSNPKEANMFSSKRTTIDTGNKCISIHHFTWHGEGNLHTDH